MSIKINDGKYHFFIAEGGHENGCLICWRYGEPWRDFIGDKAVHALYDHAVELEARVKTLEGELECAEDELEMLQEQLSENP